MSKSGFPWNSLARLLTKAHTWSGQQTFSNINITGGSITGAVTTTLPMATSTNPGVSAATTVTIVDANSGVIILQNDGSPAAQTIGSPTVVTAGKIFTVVNNDTSVDNVVVNGFTVTPGEAQSFIWDGSAWGPTDLGITDIPVKIAQGGTGQITASAAMNALGVPSATAENDFIVSGSSPFAWIKNTLAQVRTLIKGDTDIADAISKKHTQGTDTALGTVGVKNSPVDDDKVIYRDSTASDALVTSTWTQVKEFLKTYFDTVYAAVLGADDNYVTDAEKIVIGNTSGINTGDQILPDSVDDLGPSQTGNAGKFLKTDGTNALWDVPAGDVVGPATNTADNVPQWNGADSKTLKNGLAIGTAANNLVQLDVNAKLPAVDGSQLTNLPSGGGGGDFLVVQVFS